MQPFCKPHGCIDIIFNLMGKQDNGLYWRFDLSTYKLLGRELITDRITALFELVKNSYDANATNVYIEFSNLNPVLDDGKIKITDDGLGMSLDNVKNKWMVIGTGSKRKNRKSPPPFNRMMVGKKGVGRFAVDKLGSKLKLTTTTLHSSDTVVLHTDWSEYEKLSAESDANTPDKEISELTELEQIKVSAQQFFTDVPNDYEILTTDEYRQGTTLEITAVRDPWTKDDIDRAYKELSKLISPLHELAYPFNIYITSLDYPDDYTDKLVVNKAIQFATLSLSLKSVDGMQQVLRHDGGRLVTAEENIKVFGPIGLQLYYFDEKAKDIFKREYQGGNIDGIKIYRDGLITTPFAEYEAQDEKKRDILGIDKRRYSGFFDRLGTRDLLGIVDITDAGNPFIKDSTNRQDFEDNFEYKELKQFIIDQIIEIEDYRKYHRNKARETTKSSLKGAHDDLKSFTKLVREIKTKAPDSLKEEMEQLDIFTTRIGIDVNKGIKAFNELEAEKVKQENFFLSLMSLQDYALELAHVVRTSLTRIIRLAEFFSTEFPNPELDEFFSSYAKEIHEEMLKLDSVVNFMLSYAKSDTDFREIDLKELIENLFGNFYKSTFEKNKIHAIAEIDKPLIIYHNQKFFEDIIENLISNSIKALQTVKHERIIKCTGLVEDDAFTLYFSDNGPGIDDDDKKRVFNIYFTRTAEQGGAGIGLYIVKTRIQSMRGSVEVVENELKPTGTTIKITLPYANKN